MSPQASSSSLDHLTARSCTDERAERRSSVESRHQQIERKNADKYPLDTAKRSSLERWVPCLLFQIDALCLFIDLFVYEPRGMQLAFITVWLASFPGRVFSIVTLGRKQGLVSIVWVIKSEIASISMQINEIQFL